LSFHETLQVYYKKFKILPHTNFKQYYIIKNKKINNSFNGLCSQIHEFGITNQLPESNHYGFEQVGSN
jgi:hypothetical protein